MSAGRTGFSGPLRKTPAFLSAHPFGSLPAAFSPDGLTGIFESNGIMRAVARSGEKRLSLYGENPYQASRVDSFLDASSSLADICFTCELCLFMNERVRRSELEKRGLAPILRAESASESPRAFGLFTRLRAQPALAPDTEPYLAKLEAAMRRS